MAMYGGLLKSYVYMFKIQLRSMKMFFLFRGNAFTVLLRIKSLQQSKLAMEESGLSENIGYPKSTH